VDKRIEQNEKQKLVSSNTSKLSKKEGVLFIFFLVKTVLKLKKAKKKGKINK